MPCVCHSRRGSASAVALVFLSVIPEGNLRLPSSTPTLGDYRPQLDRSPFARARALPGATLYQATGKINPENLAYFSEPAKCPQKTIFTAQFTVNSPAIYREMQPHFAKPPAKTCFRHHQKQSSKQAKIGPISSFWRTMSPSSRALPSHTRRSPSPVCRPRCRANSDGSFGSSTCSRC